MLLHCVDVILLRAKMRLSKTKASESTRGALLVSMAKFMGGDTESIIDLSFVDELEPLVLAVGSGWHFESALNDVKLGSLAPFKEIPAIAARTLLSEWRRHGAFAVLKNPPTVKDNDRLIPSKHSCVFVESVNREVAKLLSDISFRALEHLEKRPKLFS